MQQNNINPVQLINVAWLKDWKKRLARITKRDDYPQCAIHVIELPMWSVGKTQAYILERLKIHAEQADDPPVCSKKERWQRDHVYAVMKKGCKNALKLCDNKDMAETITEIEQARAKPGEKFFIEERPTEPVRCLDWCNCAPFCDYGIAAKKKWRENGIMTHSTRT